MRFFILVFVVFVFGLAASSEEAGPDVTQVTVTFEAWKADPDDRKKINALKEALGTYDGDPTVETLNAHIGLLGHAVQTERPRDLRQTALAAATHLEPVADIVPQQYGQAAYIAAVALFNDRQNPNAMIEMAELEGRMSAVRDEEGDRPEFAEDLYWKAQAWRGAMKAYFISVDRRQKIDEEAVEAILTKWKELEQPLRRKDSDGDGESASLPKCKGEFIQEPKMRYPSGGAFRGAFGAVILGFGFDKEGRVADPKVLAAIPVDGFEDEVIETMSKWRFVPENPDAVGVSCRIERRNNTQQYVFQLR